MKTKTYSLEEFYKDCCSLAEKIRAAEQEADITYEAVYGIRRGGIPVAMQLSQLLEIPIIDKLEKVSVSTLIVDDIVDSGKTLLHILSFLSFPRSFPHSVSLHSKKQSYFDEKGNSIPTFCANRGTSEWIVYWWEGSEAGSIEDAIVRQLEFIGEDPTREGLKSTPARVIKSWKEIFSGYHQKDLSLLFKTFDSDGYDQIILLKDVEVYSICEHHMLPFFGKAHVAYIPNERIIGVSKLARLVDIYARRLQLQERICEQVTEVLMDYLNPLGAACIIEAVHMCMRMRGCSKQNSSMITSSLRGCFMSKAKARQELMSLIK